MNPTFVTYWSAEGHLGCLCFLTTWMERQGTWQSKCLWSRTCGSLGICPRMVPYTKNGRAGCYGIYFWLFWIFHTHLQKALPVCNLSNSDWGFPFPHIFSSICCHFVWSLYTWKRFSPTSVASLTRLVVSLAVKKPFGFMRTHLSIVGLNSWAYGILFKKTFSTPVSADYRLVIILALPVFQVQVLCKVIDAGLFPFSARGVLASPVLFYRCVLYSSVCFWQICQILDVCSYVYSYVDLLFVPLVYMYASTIIHWFWFYYSVVYSEIITPLVLLFSRFLWLSRLYYDCT